MTKAQKVLQKMRNSARDWRIEEIKTLAERYGMIVRNPRGSHVIFSHPSVTEILSIPAHKPLKPVYIFKLVEMIDTIENAK
ncbi:MAG: type II toxin-antitoxin system HicA family toxin [Magnetococcales bacterium]|nr:type II toxin-antitoxin system HicA family toxin [Magnetococcales bacterium]